MVLAREECIDSPSPIYDRTLQESEHAAAIECTVPTIRGARLRTRRDSFQQFLQPGSNLSQGASFQIICLNSIIDRPEEIIWMCTGQDEWNGVKADRVVWPVCRSDICYIPRILGARLVVNNTICRAGQLMTRGQWVEAHCMVGRIRDARYSAVACLGKNVFVGPAPNAAMPRCIKKNHCDTPPIIYGASQVFISHVYTNPFDESDASSLISRRSEKARGVKLQRRLMYDMGDRQSVFCLSGQLNSRHNWMECGAEGEWQGAGNVLPFCVNETRCVVPYILHGDVMTWRCGPSENVRGIRRDCHTGARLSIFCLPNYRLIGSARDWVCDPRGQWVSSGPFTMWPRCSAVRSPTGCFRAVHKWLRQ